MDLHAWIAVVTLVVAMSLFISKLIPLEMTALAIPVVLAVTGVIEPAEAALRGFGSTAVIALGAIFILGAGLKESGVATLVAMGLERVGGGSRSRLVVVTMIGTCLLSGFMSNAATVAVLLPAVAVLARRTLIPASRLMMPLAYAAILGGTLTLVATTSNLVIDAELQTRMGEGLGMFAFSRVGLPVAAIGIVYMALIGVRLLPDRGTVDRMVDAHLPEELILSYGVLKNLCRVKVLPGSPLVGRSVAEARMGEGYGLDLVVVRRPGALRRRYFEGRPELRIEMDDRLYVEGDVDEARRFAVEQGLGFGMAGPEQLARILGHGTALVEVTLAPHSPVAGSTFRELEFRRRFGLNVLSVWRKDGVIHTGVGDLKLKIGDTFLVTGRAADIANLRRNPEFLVLTEGAEQEDVRRAPLAVLLLVAALVPPLLGWLPLAISCLASALLMVATRCVSLEGARKSIDFRILFLVIGTIPLGMALEQQGVAQLVADTLFPPEAAVPAVVVYAVLFAITAVVSISSNNAAAVVIIAPVAAQAAATSGVPIADAFLAVAFGASCAFVLPFAHQCNLMVMGPGGYRTKDFVKVGSGLSVVMGAATVLFLTLS